MTRTVNITLLGAVLVLARDAHAQQPPDGLPAAEEQELAREARVDTILRLALARNPLLEESALRARAAAARTRAADRLPDPEVKYEQWGVPLMNPTGLREADTLMVGVRQTLPPWGARDARQRIAAEDARSTEDDARARRRDLIAEVRRTYAEYARTDHEVRLHREHVALTSRLVELARLNYQSGRGTQQDVLRLGLELSRLHADIARIEQERRSSAALLNTLMNRPPTAPLGPTPAPEPPARVPGVDELAKDLEARRPDVALGQRAVRRSEAALDLVRSEAGRPSLMLGLDYMYMPFHHEPHAYGAMVAMSVPWLGGRRAEVEEAEQTVRADRRALEAARLAARFDLTDAAARVQAAQESFAVVDRDLMPQAQRALDATQAAFSVGQGNAVDLLDSLRSYLQVRVERIRAIARIWSAVAALERAAGKEVAR